MGGEKASGQAVPPDTEKKDGSVSINREYKDRVFRKLFGESKENALSLYNAVNGSSYTDPEDLQFNMIDGALYMGMRNDLSFLLRMELNLYEHQSTPSPNMPIRGLRYLVKAMDAYIHAKGLNIYGDSLQKLPTPEYVVFYNGETDMPDYYELRLTDAFDSPEKSCVEMTAKVYNINYGRNAELMAKCEPLRGYAILVDKLRRYHKEGMAVKDAADRAVDECIKENVLLEFLVKNRTEVAGMFLTEYEEAERLRLEKLESHEEGRKEGLLFALKNMMETLNMTLTEAMNALKVPSDERQMYIDMLGAG